MEFEHIPVLLDESLELLELRSGSKVLDATFGHGGHAVEMLKRIGPEGILVANDRDESTERYYKEIKNRHDNILRTDFPFSRLDMIAKKSGIKKFDSVFLDLGVCSEQFDNSSRGFSFQRNGNLDMRMDRRQEMDAFTVVNEASMEELERIFREYGEEWRGRKIAEALVEQRKKSGIATTEDLCRAIGKVVRRKGKIHPATKVFQALRIHVNDELGELKNFLTGILNYLNPGARLCIISFHSLEDRIVKQTFKRFAGKCICGLPLMECQCKREKLVRILTKKPVAPSREEIRKNRRSRSAKMRVIEKI